MVGGQRSSPHQNVRHPASFITAARHLESRSLYLPFSMSLAAVYSENTSIRDTADLLVDSDSATRLVSSPCASPTIGYFNNIPPSIASCTPPLFLDKPRNPMFP